MAKKKNRPNLTTRNLRNKAKQRINERKVIEIDDRPIIDIKTPEPGQLYQCKIWGHRYMVGGVIPSENKVYGMFYPNRKPLKAIEDILLKQFDEANGEEDGMTRDEFKTTIAHMLSRHNYIADNRPPAEVKACITNFTDDPRVYNARIMDILYAIHEEKMMPLDSCFVRIS